MGADRQPVTGRSAAGEPAPPGFAGFAQRDAGRTVPTGRSSDRSWRRSAVGTTPAGGDTRISTRRSERDVPGLGRAISPGDRDQPARRPVDRWGPDRLGRRRGAGTASSRTWPVDFARPTAHWSPRRRSGTDPAERSARLTGLTVSTRGRPAREHGRHAAFPNRASFRHLGGPGPPHHPGPGAVLRAGNHRPASGQIPPCGHRSGRRRRRLGERRPRRPARRPRSR